MIRHNGSLCSKFVSDRLPITIKNRLMFTDKNQPVDLENMENMFEWIKGVLETVVTTNIRAAE